MYVCACNAANYWNFSRWPWHTVDNFTLPSRPLISALCVCAHEACVLLPTGVSVCVSAVMNMSQCVRDYRDSQSVDLQFSHQHDLGDCNQRCNCATGLLSNVGLVADFLISLPQWGRGEDMPTAHSHTYQTLKCVHSDCVHTYTPLCTVAPAHIYVHI